MDNYYVLTLPDGTKKELRAMNDQAAARMALGVLKRWNQLKATLSRINPFNATERREILGILNTLYNPQEESRNEDPDYVPTETPRKKRKKRSSRGSGTSAPVVTHEVPLNAIAEKLSISPTALRRKLRSSSIEKPGARWGWDSWEHPDVVEILTWR